ncbi:MAG TPA: PQQ-dependent sugar dehydrogenase [Candidatus Dormibacteraeota bacterium]|nr:PQQ-dependent sugar dehydrogenase [Candidatus Dormibacteraeota bacterium]
MLPAERVSSRPFVSARHPGILAVTVAVAILAACGPVTPAPATTEGTASSSRSSSSSAISGSPPPSGASGSTPSAGPSVAGPFDPAGLVVGLDTVVGGLDAPLGVTSAGDGSGRIFVTEQGGQIRIVRDGTLVATPYLDIAGRITSGGERGLLGLAFHPTFPSDPRFFVDYTDTNGDTQVSSFTVDPGTPDVADPSSEVKILHIAQPYANHNGGAVVFGPDGFLYISTGDGGSGGDPQGNGQSLTTLLGKILRIDVDRTGGAQPYAVPSDNPFVGRADTKPEIYLYGLRNPWRISFDRATRDLWIGDVGQNAWEEVDVARAGTSGENYGWNTMEGNHCFNPPSGCSMNGLTLPVAEYGHDAGCTVIGGNVYRGSAQPALTGGYFFGDYCSGTIWAIDPGSAALRAPTVVLKGSASLSSFGEDEAGELYATDIGGGNLLRVTGQR